MRFLILFLCATLPVHAVAAPESNPGKVARFTREADATIAKCKYVASPVSRKGGDVPLCQSSFLDLHGDRQPVTVVNDEYSMRIFQEMTTQGKIPFGFPEDGCFARAQEMCYLLEHRSPPIMTGKVFAMGEFHLENDKAAKGNVAWGFHVAPFFILDNGHGRHIWVVDPSLFYEPEPLDKWLSELTSEDRSKLREVFLTSRFIYLPNQRHQKRTEYAARDRLDSQKVMKKYRGREAERESKQSPDF